MKQTATLFLPAFIFLATLSFAQSSSLSSIKAVPTINLVSTDGTYGESVGALCFSVSISNPEPDTTFVDVVVVTSSTGSLGNDFTITPTTIKFLPNFTGNESVCVGIVNDALVEPIEIYSLKITNASNSALINDSLINFTIYDDDSVTTTNPCSDLFFSEFVHSFTAGDRAFELYNPTGQVADLSHYTIKIYFGGNTVAGTVIPLAGFLNAADTYVISYFGSDSIVRSLSDTVNGQFFYNGGNVIGLYHNTTLVDIYGILGVNPGQFWPVGSSTTTSSTLVRKQDIKQGETTWAVSNGQWDVYPQGDYTHLGNHTINGCGFVLPPTVTMFTSDASFNEAVGSLVISAKIFNPLATATTVDVVLGSNTTATNLIDFTFSPTQLTFPANSTAPQFITINILDELNIEPDEVVELRLQNVSSGATILDSSWQLTIQNDDFTGIKSITPIQSLILQPNPVKDFLFVSLNTAIESYHISNLLGQIILQESQLNSKQLKINLQDLEAGIYFITTKNNEKITTKRFVKD